MKDSMKIHGLRSPYEPVGGFVYFARMIDKIRLHSAGLLPSEYQPFLGNANPRSFDALCCRFLQIDFTALAAIVLQGGTDIGIFQWACAHGRKPSEKDVEVWNAFMQKRGWRDDSSARLRERALESGIEDRVVPTFFDYLDADEGRPARFPDDPGPPGERVTGGDRIPGLRSPRDKVGGVFHFGRMLDKIRLFHQGKLPQGWIESKGSPNGFDGNCCGFLKIDYGALEAETTKGRGDDQMLQWAFVNGRQPTNEEVDIWNAYLFKRCWRDRYTPRLDIRLQEAGWPIGTVLTMFDFVDLDEGRRA